MEAGRNWRAATEKRERGVAGNVVFSGGGVGCGVLSILRGESRKGARSSYENKSSDAGCP